MALLVLGSGAVFLLALQEFCNRRKGLTYRCWINLLNTATVIEQYHDEHGAWPSSLDEEPFRSLGTADIYGNTLVYGRFASGGGYIRSLGRDGKEGGSLLDRDMEIRFPLDRNWGWNRKEKTALLARSSARGIGFRATGVESSPFTQGQVTDQENESGE